MDRKRYLECLAADEARLRELATGDLTAPVPSCPGWTMSDLAVHVAAVYLHKVETMRIGKEPPVWPPDFSGEEPLTLLDRAYRSLVDEFAARPSDEEQTHSWYDPDQTVGFWVRRMAHETVIHRIDAELAAGAEIADVPVDLALDGIDEVLVVFLAFAVRMWPGEFTDHLPTDERRVLVDAGAGRWLVRLAPGQVAVDRAPAADVAADASLTAGPADLLRWLWRRADADAVRMAGDLSAVDRLRAVLGLATQ